MVTTVAPAAAARSASAASSPSGVPPHDDAAPGRRDQAIVIGGGLGGLSAAVHLQLAGWHVTLFEANEEVGGRAGRLVRQGYQFDLGPSLLNYPWVFEELFRRAGRRLADYMTLLPVEPSVAFMWPDGTRLRLSSDFRRLLQEFERLEPGCRVGAISFFADAAAKYRIAFDTLVTRDDRSFVRWMRRVAPRDLPKLSLWRSLDRELQRYFRSRHIREALGSYAMYLGGSPFDLPGFFSILPYGELAYGLWLPKGGIYGLIDALARLARELGVDIRTSSRVQRIDVANGRVQGVQLACGSRRRAAIVVSGVDVPTTDTELLDATVAGRRRARAQRTHMTPGVMTYYLGIRGRLEGLEHHTIFLPPDYRATFADVLEKRRLPEQLAFYVSVASATDPALAPPGCSTVFILVPAPLASDLPPAEWTRLHDQVLTRVLDRLAQHTPRLTADRIVVKEVLTPDRWQERCGLYQGSAFGAAHTIGQVGPLRAWNSHPDVNGMFYVGAGTTPGTGLPMVALSGRMVAERVAMHHRPEVG